ncbi:MAG TPA: glycosylase [Planctomycetaceae bacterium]|nr:glycosylase [Planctomycetaceae bacterium]
MMEQHNIVPLGLRRIGLSYWAAFVGCWLATALPLGALCGAEPQADPDFPPELVRFQNYPKNPVFQAEGAGHWDVKIRERGWILRDQKTWHLWFTGYDGTREGRRMLGYATSPDGLQWTRSEHNPLDRDHWIEDMMVLERAGTFYMFAEGERDQAQWLTSKDRIHWKREGTLNIRLASGEPIPPGPFGTPTAWYEDETWHLFYERSDLGVYLARSKDLKTWTNVQDEPVLARGPEAYDKQQIALNQIIRHKGRYYAYYHGSASTTRPALWTTSVATSTDLIHWKKYAGNPLTPEQDNRSSGIVIPVDGGFRLYTMHDAVNVSLPVEGQP